MPHLFDNFIGPWGQANYAGNEEVGNWFAMTAPVEVTHLRWLRTDTTAAHKPDGLRLWDSTTGQVVAELAMIPDNLLQGWQEGALVTPFRLVVGRSYCVSIGATPDPWPAYVSSTGYDNPPAPAIFDEPVLRFSFSQPTPTIPLSPTEPGQIGADITWQAASPAGGEIATPSDVFNALVEWFDPLEANRPSSNVKLYPRVVGKLDALSTAAITWLNNRSAQLVDFLNGVSAAAVSFLNDPLPQMRTARDESGTPVKTPGGVTVISTALATQSQLNTVAAQVTAIQGGVDELSVGVGAFPAGWTQLDVTAFTEAIIWPVAAQLYVVNFTALPPGHSEVISAGLTWHPRLAWWTPINGDFGQQRQFADFAHYHAHIGGATMPGLMFVSKPGAAGTIQAWYRP